MFKNKDGFTIIELIIVIAIIAILAAVLIPTFGNIIRTANESSALQVCTSAYKEALAEVMKDGKITDGETSKTPNNGFTFTFSVDNSGKISDVTANYTGTKYIGYVFSYNSDGSWSLWTANADT